MSMHVPVFALNVMRATILGRHTTLTLKEGKKAFLMFGDENRPRVLSKKVEKNSNFYKTLS